jgi:hypothetical protein
MEFPNRNLECMFYLAQYLTHLVFAYLILRKPRRWKCEHSLKILVLSPSLFAMSNTKTCEEEKCALRKYYFIFRLQNLSGLFFGTINVQRVTLDLCTEIDIGLSLRDVCPLFSDFYRFSKLIHFRQTDGQTW